MYFELRFKSNSLFFVVPQAFPANVYVSKGCPKSYYTQLIPAARDSTHAVRCCSNNENTCTSVKCSEKVNYDEALNICQARGERLCFQDELDSRCCGTGCGINNDWVWVANKVAGWSNKYSIFTNHLNIYKTFTSKAIHIKQILS